MRLAVLGCSDHPADFAAEPVSPGIARVEIQRSLGWLPHVIAALKVEAVLVTPHWGPNMTPEPLPYVRRAASALREAGATLVAGHSAHVFRGVQPRILYDLGDFIDDYAVNPRLRNDLGLLFLVTLHRQGPVSLEAIPPRLEFCHTRLADDKDAAWIRRGLRLACSMLGTEVSEEDGRLVVHWRSSGRASTAPVASRAQ